MFTDTCMIYCKDKKERIPQVSIKSVWDEFINYYTIDMKLYTNDYKKMIIDQDIFTKDSDNITRILFMEKHKNLKNWDSIILINDILKTTITITKDTLVKVHNKGFIPVSSIEIGDLVPFWFHKSFFDLVVVRHDSLGSSMTGYNIITESKEYIASGLIVSNE